ncbi:uncharacterized protein LOC127257891 [Andrographis paniculata]|uniref:uncharacterized protein LOC127257891 n=1 Tax=Andrographis paniculata TaxID=175694 RepID=UPI0021E81556|nr:uncharacterized protein LOC127257891 [Andrographis paniculata]
MVEFGDELMIESFKVPWLIWIQLLVTILLLILLFFGLSVFSLDSSASSAAPPISLSTNHGINPVVSNRVAKVECRQGRRDAGTSEGSTQQEDHSGEGSSSLTGFQHPMHLCNYFGLAKRAIFKCFGLESSPESSSRSRQHEKQE